MNIQDRAYFMDPLPRHTTKIKEDAQIVFFGSRRETGHQFGDVISIKGSTWDYNRFWFIDEDGMHVRGALLDAEQTSNSVPTIGLLGDDALFGLNYGIVSPGTIAMGRARRWSRRLDRVLRQTVTDYRVSLGVRAAPWADSLWPQTNDTDEMVAAKTALAKAKWESRQKHIEVLQEGTVRQWLSTLEDKDFFSEFGMPKPVLGAYVTGMVSVPTTMEVPAENLTTSGQAILDGVQAMRHGRTDTFSATIQIPINVVVPGQHGYTSSFEYNEPVTQLQITRTLGTVTGRNDVTFSAGNLRPLVTSVN